MKTVKTIVRRRRHLNAIDENDMIEFQRVVNDFFNLIIKTTREISNAIVSTTFFVFAAGSSMAVMGRLAAALEQQNELMEARVSSLQDSFKYPTSFVLTLCSSRRKALR